MGTDRRKGRGSVPSARTRAFAAITLAVGRAQRTTVGAIRRAQLGPIDESARRDRPVRWLG